MKIDKNATCLMLISWDYPQNACLFFSGISTFVVKLYVMSMWTEVLQLNKIKKSLCLNYDVAGQRFLCWNHTRDLNKLADWINWLILKSIDALPGLSISDINWRVNCKAKMVLGHGETRLINLRSRLQLNVAQSFICGCRITTKNLLNQFPFVFIATLKCTRGKSHKLHIE